MFILQYFRLKFQRKISFLIFMFFISLDLWAKFSSCEQSDIVSSQSDTQFSIYLGMDKKKLDDLGVFGAEVDQIQVDKISKMMFGTHQLNVVMPSKGNAVEGSTKKYIIERLVELKGKAGEKALINFFYSGHGHRCRDLKYQIEHWCLGVGQKSFSEKYPKDNDKALQSFEIISPSGGVSYLSADDVITEEEIMAVLSPHNMILDSCHSGIASDVLLNRKSQVAGHTGVFVLASSLSDQISNGHEEKGGIFLNTLLRILESNQKKIACLMDWESNGEITDQALSIGLMLALTPEQFKIPNSKELKMYVHKEALKNGFSSAIEKHEYQLPVSNPNGSCLMRHNFQCSKKALSTFVPKNKCDLVLLKHRDMANAIDTMISHRKNFRDLIDAEIKNSPGRFQRSFQAKGDFKVLNPYHDKMSVDQYGSDSAIMLFLEKFKYDLEDEFNVSCPLEIDANGCYRNQFKNNSDDLEKIFADIEKLFKRTH